MNIYQHSLILIPAIVLIWHGMTGEASFSKLFCTFLGLIIMLMYPITFLAFFALNVFSYLGGL